MKKIIVIIVALLLLGIGGFFIFKSRTNAGEAMLKVNSSPQTTIFLNDQNIGKTPYEGKHPAGEYTLKLIPDSSTENLISWEGKIKLTANLLTYVNRELGQNDITTAGEILTLEKISSDKSEVTVVSTPSTAQVLLGSQEKNSTPLNMEDIDPGNYDLSVSLAGYKPRTVKIKTTQGYKLTASFQLAVSGEVIPSPSPEAVASPGGSPGPTPKATPNSSPKATPKASASSQASPPPKPYVEILDTPTGFLRVRSEPSTSAEEVGRVNPEELYPLLDEDSG